MTAARTLTRSDINAMRTAETVTFHRTSEESYIRITAAKSGKVARIPCIDNLYTRNVVLGPQEHISGFAMINDAQHSEVWAGLVKHVHTGDDLVLAWAMNVKAPHIVRHDRLEVDTLAVHVLKENGATKTCKIALKMSVADSVSRMLSVSRMVSICTQEG